MKTAINDWKKVRLDECFDIQQGKQVSKSNRLGNNQRPFLRTANIFWNKLDLANLDQMNFTQTEEEKFALLKGDLLVCEGGDIGRTAMWNGILERCYYQNHLHRLRKLNDSIDETFTLLYLQYAFVYAKLYSGRANVTTIPNLSKSRLSELEIPLPSLQEQKAIARTLTTLQEATAIQEELVNKLKELKKSMMQHFFTHGTKGEKTKMTDIGEIPENWETIKLGDVGEVFYGIQAAVASLLKPVGFKILTNKNITLDGSITLEKINYFQPKTKRETSSFIEKGDILLNWRSGSKEHVGKTAIYLGDEKMLHSSFILRIKTNRDRIRNKYLYYYLNWLRETGYFVKLQTYSVNAKFNKSSVIAMKIAIPPIKDQDIILDALDSLSLKLNLTQKKLDLYNSIFKTLLHELMTGKRRVAGYEN